MAFTVFDDFIVRHDLLIVFIIALRNIIYIIEFDRGNIIVI